MTDTRIAQFLHDQVEAWNAGNKEAFFAAYRRAAPNGLQIEYVGRSASDGWPVLETMWAQQSAKIQIEEVVPRVYSMSLNCGYNTDGRATYGDGGGNCESVNAAYWGDAFTSGGISKLLTSKNDDEFDAAWDEVIAKFYEDGDYDLAKTDVANWFAEFGPEELRDKVKL